MEGLNTSSDRERVLVEENVVAHCEHAVAEAPAALLPHFGLLKNFTQESDCHLQWNNDSRVLML